jgi:hypothetical protein
VDVTAVPELDAVTDAVLAAERDAEGEAVEDGVPVRDPLVDRVAVLDGLVVGEAELEAVLEPDGTSEPDVTKKLTLRVTGISAMPPKRENTRHGCKPAGSAPRPLRSAHAGGEPRLARTGSTNGAAAVASATLKPSAVAARSMSTSPSGRKAKRGDVELGEFAERLHSERDASYHRNCGVPPGPARCHASTAAAAAGATTVNAPLDRSVENGSPAADVTLSVTGGLQLPSGNSTKPMGHAHAPVGAGSQFLSHDAAGGVGVGTTHTAEPGSELVPAGHASQPPTVLKLPASSLYVPTGHGSQCDDAPTIVWPAPHTHCDGELAPGTANAPAGQGKHAPVAALKYAAGGQAKTNVSARET